MEEASKKTYSSVRQPKLNPTFRPDGLSLERWQIGLRKQAAEKALFRIINQPTDSHFGEYTVENPASDRQYSVQFYGTESDWNSCSCMDFKTNQLGTCKHLEWLIHKITSNTKALKKAFVPAHSGLYLTYKGERRIVLRIGTEHQNKLIKLAQPYFDSQFVLATHGYQNIEAFVQKARTIIPSFECHHDVKSWLIEEREKTLRESIISQNHPDGKLTGLLKANLYPYQEKGILFAALKGKSIIADEMGLGKTIQAIGTAELLRKELGISSVLVACPTSLKYQWKKEIERFTDSAALVVEGLHYQRKKQYQRDEFFKIVSYNSLANDLKILKTMKFDMVIMDEAQRLKNWNTQISKATKRLHSDYTVIISGTPLENKIEELYSLTQYIDPYCLGPYYRLMDETRVASDTGKVVGYKNLNSVSEKLNNILIRRRKCDVALQLPERIDQTLFVPLTKEQYRIHEDAQTVVSQLVTKWNRMKFLSEKDRQLLLMNMSIMRMVSDSTFILDQKSRHETKIAELIQILKDYFDNGGEKAVIFSQWERMTRIITQELELHQIGFQYLHGGISSSKRKNLVDDFTNNPESKVFVSTDSGSTGLNLQAASLLINMDLPWSPAVLEQRIARIHRIGQKNNIQIINFVSSNSIEERMLSTLNFKTALFDGILNAGDDSIFLEDKQLVKLIEVIQPMAEEESQTTTDKPRSVDSEEPEVDTTTQQNDEVIQNSLFDDYDESDDEMPEETEPKATTTPTDLVQQGVSFFASLADTLTSPEKTQQLLDSIVEEDKQTGETYLKIAIPNKESVAHMFQLLGKLIK